MKILFLSLVIFAVAVSAFAQVSEKREFPNQLKGYELIGNPKLEKLIFGVTTRDEANEITKDFMRDCKTASHDNDAACQFDENWDIGFTFSEDEKLSSVKFYPRQRITRKEMKFSKAFTKGGMGIVHSINAGMYTTYTDKYNLTYVFTDESDNAKYRKSDLFYIEYSDGK